MNPSRIPRRWCGWLLVSVALISSRLQADPVVGPLGDLGAAKIEGCKRVPEEQVRRALQTDMEVQILRAPSASQTKFLNAVQQQLVGGYENAGFPNARVFAGPDDEGKRLLIRVDEGRQYTIGKLRFAGVGAVDVDPLRRRLTEERPAEVSPAEITPVAGTLFLPTWQPPKKASKPQWAPGHPAPFNDAFRNAIRRELVEALFVQGYCWADVRPEMVLNEDGTADLLVTILNEGPRAEIDEFEVDGATINTPGQIREFLGLQKGSSLNLSVLREARLKLWNSARFIKHDFHAQFDRTRPGKAKLRLAVREHPAAPPLTVALEKSSPLIAPLLRASELLRQSLLDGGAVVVHIEGPGGSAYAALDSRNGFAARVRLNERAPATAPSTAPSSVPAASGPATRGSGERNLRDLFPPREQVDLVLGVRQSGVTSELLGRQYMIRDVQSPLGIAVNLDCIPNTGDDQTRVSLNVGAGFTSLHPDQPIDFRLTVAPVFIFNLVNPGDVAAAGEWTTETRDGVVTFTRGQTNLRLDAVTHRLIDLSSGFDGSRFRLTVEEQGFETLCGIINGTHATNVHAADRRVSSFVGFVLDYLDRWPGPALAERVKRPLDVARRLVDQRVLAALDALPLRREGAGDEFRTMPAFAKLQSSPLVALRFLIWVPDELFPYGTWPWTLCRETMLTQTGGSVTASSELKRLVARDQMGPVGCLAVAEALQPIDASLSRGVAGIGLGRLTAADFARDFRDLLQGDRAGQKVVASLLQSLGETDPATFPTGTPDALRFISRLHQADPGTPVIDLLAASQQAWWEQTLRAPVEARLKELSEEPQHAK